jgi:hypothetical protein
VVALRLRYGHLPRPPYVASPATSTGQVKEVVARRIKSDGSIAAKEINKELGEDGTLRRRRP